GPRRARAARGARHVGRRAGAGAAGAADGDSRAAVGGRRAGGGARPGRAIEGARHPAGAGAARDRRGGHLARPDPGGAVLRPAGGAEGRASGLRRPPGPSAVAGGTEGGVRAGRGPGRDGTWPGRRRGPEFPVIVPTFEDVQDAARRLEGQAVRTPLLRDRALDQATGAKVFIKAECLQRTGSFKFRGAYNRICRLTPDELKRGVVAFSSGNHAQGVAAAAALMGTPAVIVMPSDAPKAKVEGTRAWGAEVVPYDRRTESREAIGARIAAERGSVLVPPFDDFHVVAGQGTVGLEAAEQLKALGETAELVLAPASGGGLVAGIGLAFGALSPTSRIFAVE